MRLDPRRREGRRVDGDLVDRAVEEPADRARPVVGANGERTCRVGGVVDRRRAGGVAIDIEGQDAGREGRREVRPLVQRHCTAVYRCPRRRPRPHLRRPDVACSHADFETGIGRAAIDRRNNRAVPAPAGDLGPRLDREAARRVERGLGIGLNRRVAGAVELVGEGGRVVPQGAALSDRDAGAVRPLVAVHEVDRDAAARLAQSEVRAGVVDQDDLLVGLVVVESRPGTHRVGDLAQHVTRRVCVLGRGVLGDRDAGSRIEVLVALGHRNQVARAELVSDGPACAWGREVRRHDRVWIAVVEADEAAWQEMVRHRDHVSGRVVEVVDLVSIAVRFRQEHACRGERFYRLVGVTQRPRPGGRGRRTAVEQAQVNGVGRGGHGCRVRRV